MILHLKFDLELDLTSLCSTKTAHSAQTVRGVIKINITPAILRPAHGASGRPALKRNVPDFRRQRVPGYYRHEIK